MSESEPDQTTIDELKARIEELEQQQEQLREDQQQIGSLFEQFKNGRISRRTFMTTAAAIAGVSYVAGSASAAPSWGSASGSIGTSSSPLNAGYIKDLQTKTFSTDDLDVGSADFVTSGDFVPLWAVTYNANASTSSSSYTFYNPDHLNSIVRWDDMWPATAQMQAAAAVDYDPNSDQVDWRLQNTTDNETIIEQTGLTGNTVFVGPSNYTPTTTAGQILVQPEFRNADGATTVSIQSTNYMIGIGL